jgi:hypothetical protein
MNIEIKLRVLDGILKTADDTKFLVFDKSNSHLCQNALLAPMYALPNDIIDFFMEYDDDSQYIKPIWRILFEGSLEADALITPYVQATYNLNTVTQFYIKRRFVISYAVYQFSKVFYRDYLKAIKKSKFLQDIKVSLDVEKDPNILKNLREDAKQEMLNIKTGLNAPYNMMGFVKGAANSYNKTTARLWMPSLGNNFPDISMATGKSPFFGKLYKVGDQFHNLYPYFLQNISGVYQQTYKYTNF